MLILNKEYYQKLNNHLFKNHAGEQHSVRYELVALTIASKLALNDKEYNTKISDAVNQANEEYNLNVDFAIKLAGALYTARQDIAGGHLKNLISGYFTFDIDIPADINELFSVEEYGTEDCKECNDAVKY